MKKTFSLLLTVAMLLAMIPTLAIGASAEPVTATPLNVTIVDELTSVNYPAGDTTQDPIDWSKFFNGTTANRFGHFFCETVCIVGKLDKPTKLGHIDLSAQYYPSRARNVQVFVSTNATDWVELGYLFANDTSNAWYRLYSFYISPAYGDTEFQYVKILKDRDRFQDADRNDDGVKDTDFDFNFACVYERTEKDEPVSVKHVSHNSDNESRNNDVDRNKAWNYELPSAAIQIYNQAAGSEMMRAQFESPTIIDTIHIVIDGSNGNRLQNCVFEGSVDGETWTTVATLPSNLSLSNYANSTIQVHSLDKTTAYNYIRIIKNNSWSFSYKSIGIFGTETGADFVGTQVKKDASSWALRLVSTVDATNLTKVGYEITAMADGMTDKIWDKSTEIVYNSIYETTTEGTNKLTALDLGGAYIFTATIHGISIEDYDEITFFVKPYVIDANGNKIYSLEQTLVYNDGVLQ